MSTADDALLYWRMVAACKRLSPGFSAPEYSGLPNQLSAMTEACSRVVFEHYARILVAVGVEPPQRTGTLEQLADLSDFIYGGDS